MLDTPLKSKLASHLVCPRCLALNLTAADCCANCDLDLAWTRHESCRHFRRALSAQQVFDSHQHWRIELRAELHWASGISQFVASFVTDTVWELPFNQRLLFHVANDDGALEIVLDETTTSLPPSGGDVELRPGVRLHVHLFVKAQEEPAPGELGANDTALTRNLEALGEFTVGRIGCTLNVAEPCFHADGPHFVMAVEPPASPNAGSRLWLADAGSESGTFVNQQRVFAALLETNDLIQVGSFGWAVWRDDAQFALIPIARIDGIGLTVEGVRATNLQPVSLKIEPGEFVAISGPSGGGKSTFLKALACVPNVRTGGRLCVHERTGRCWDTHVDPDGFRQLLGYVSQESVLHDSLTPRQALKYVAALRGQALDGSHIEWMLLRAEIPASSRANPIRTLSGGENKRLRTAAEFTSSPRLLLLDEPDSGLDAERRRRLLKHLKTLSRQGCTIVVISHGSENLLADGFDRVLRMESQSLVDDSRPSPTRTSSSTAVQSRSLRSVRTRQLREAVSQFLVLVSREVSLWLADPIVWPRGLRRFRKWLPQLPGRLATMFLVAIVFAVALAIAIPSHHRHLLGFLSAVSVLWMSSSLSLMAIVGERAVFDHERHLFLRVAPYVFGKFVVHLVLAGLQCAVFVSVLLGLRWLISSAGSAPSFVTGQVGVSVLTLLGVAATGTSLGLCVSAVAKRHKEVATLVLPLIMIAQIVFSAPIAEGRPNDSLAVAYRDFSWPLSGFGKDHTPNTEASTASDANAVQRIAALLSYFTVSRYGDIALRGINEDSPRTAHESAVAQSAVFRARLMLAAHCLLFTATTLALLARQSSAAQRHSDSPSETGT